ncbi:MAG: hypothetical protein NT154_28910 [Verrucomicrobia bacterium]|nr:hypothetical protein [Verrucomicrobiota bacterium]
MISSAEQCARPFLFERDTFAFANELILQYRFDPVTGAMTTFRTAPAPSYAHRCFVMVRSARQFFYHARFDPELAGATPENYRRLIGEVIARNPRGTGAGQHRVVIPGYDSLRAFSRAHERLLKAECGGPWDSYFVRSHWRMTFPIWRRHQARMARQVQQALRNGTVPIVHLFRFPRISINPGIVLFGATESAGDLQFAGYDPNIPDRPVTLHYNRAGRTFSFPRTHYWAGGELNVIEIYLGGLY